MSHTRTGLNAGILIRAARIWSGLFLLVFVTSHLLNLSLGLISLQAMDAARPYLSGIWPSALLTLALVVHFALGLWAIYKRPTLRTNTQDIVQLLTGVMVMPLLATHAIGVVMVSKAGVDLGYQETNQIFWVSNPGIGLLQVILLTVVWVHGAAGLFTWLRAKEGARDLLPWLYPVAVAVPVVALLGFAEAGRSVLTDAHARADEAASMDYATPKDGLTDAPAAPEPAPMPEIPFALIQQVTSSVIWGSIALTALTFLARLLRVSLRKSHPVTLTRDGGPPLMSRSGLSVLDGFVRNDQPHANLCAGRGRCGTCAVRVLASEFPLPAASELERRTLQRVGAPEDARLACQLQPDGGSVDLVALYPADYTFHDTKADPAPTSGPEPEPAA